MITILNLFSPICSLSAGVKTRIKFLPPRRLITSLSSNLEDSTTFSPMFITGITDGDGNFSVSIIQSPKHKLGWVVQFSYSIVAGANPPNHNMLLSINSYFNNKGTIIYKKGGNCYILKFSNLKDCLMIKDHFLKYPLLTSKLNYFLIWSQVLDIIVSKKHLTSSGLLEIVNLKAQFNEGLSLKLLENFPSATSSKLEYRPNFTKLDLDWLAGFINADGSFSLGIQKSKEHSLGLRVSPKITITQNNTSLSVLEFIINSLGFGSIYKHDREGLASRAIIFSVRDINTFIFKFENIQFHGAKALDYLDFCKGIELINKKAHLTLEGLNNIVKLSQKMNSRRIFKNNPLFKLKY